ncbi:sulfite exporter TauE/SafE family protein [Exiguobacterium sp. s102]|uniref:sulfite exporter TauE/SafE family protein n=1 Tax=Exiguobacterium sp. s102 TaxID=2751212 RepID=UPI001BE568FE|nr:sulfite exporter TauE/SafE family protein [Exiguobacterium sp. s102]
MEFILFILLGSTIGILSGFFGIGGGIILTPLLLILGYPPSTAIVLSLLLTLGSTVTGTVSHMRLKNFHVRDALAVGLSGIVGSAVITPVVFWLEQRTGADAMISALYIVLLTWFAIQFLKPPKRKPVEGHITQANLYKLIVIGFAAGILSSLMGVSGGFLLTPLLMGWVRFPLKQAIGTSIASATLIVLGGVTSYLASGTEAPLYLGIALIVGAFIGSPIGASLLHLFEDRFVRKSLGIFYAVVAVSVVLKVLEQETGSLILLGIFTIGLLLLFFYQKVRSRHS